MKKYIDLIRRQNMAYKNQTTINISWGGLGLFLLFLLFLGLKLGGVINWSWWWVTAPIWIPWGLTLVAAVVVFIIYLIVGIVRALKARNAVK